MLGGLYLMINSTITVIIFCVNVDESTKNMNKTDAD